jgi:hypothetical protein
VIERFLFDGIDGEARRRSITERVQLAADVLTNVAKTSLALADAAKARTKRAECLAVALRMPPERFLHEGNIPLLTRHGKGETWIAGPDFPLIVL